MRCRVLRALSVIGLFASLSTSACKKQVETEPPVGASTKEGPSLPDKPIGYSFDSLDERPVSSAAHRGKPTVMAFITTGDIVGQAQVAYLVAMAKNDASKVNYAVIAIHPRKEIVLVEAYIAALKIEFPVALGESTALMQNSPFGEIPAVPTVVVLDRDGKIVWKHTGLAKADELRGHMRSL